MRKLTLAAAAIALVCALLWVLTIPATVPASALPPHTPDVDNGRTMFNIGGCASCHATPNKDAAKVDRTRLGGGLALNRRSAPSTCRTSRPTPMASGGGARRISSPRCGRDLAHGRHLFPAFPYTSYQHMELADVRDLFAYLKTLPPVSGRARRHDLAFPFNVRRLVGLWKVLYLHGGPFRRDPSQSAQWNRGAYLVNGPGHCAECHSPRNFLGAVVASERFAGGPSPDGKGWVPNITPVGLQHWSNEDIAWSAKDIASFLDDGMNPAGDFAGGAMVETIRNTSKLDAANRAAIAAYIVSLPPRQGPKPPPKK